MRVSNFKRGDKLYTSYFEPFILYELYLEPFFHHAWPWPLDRGWLVRKFGI